MKTIYLMLFLCLLNGALYAQETRFEENPFNWMTFENESVEGLISGNKSKLGLAENDGLEIKSHEIDDLMIVHKRYTQSHKGVAIDGAQYVLHQSDDELWGNGRLVYGITANENPAISKADALQNAMVYIGAPEYYWEDQTQEDFIKWLKDDPEATFFPTAELVFADEQFSQNGAEYQLYWKFDIYAHGEKLREYVYVNATDGSIGHSRDAICYGSVEGTAETHFYGEQTIITDSVGPNTYRLVDETRGGGIYTEDLELSPPSFEAGTQIEDEDNIWDSDMAGPTAHWCAEMTYDFYLDRYDRNSFDDNNAKMLTYVNMGNGSTCIPAGFFSGLYISIGKAPFGVCDAYITYLEHIGHEYTHGVIAHSSALEGGARASELNESFSNIMGTAIEFYADPDNATWEFKATIPYDMSDPNTMPFPGPDTYLGNYWVEVGDSGYDPHINATVQDYWYYLLSDGGTGVNDNGDSYAVQGIGIEAATDIVYRNLTLYLVPSTTFIDARHGSILAAIDLYGECSNEVVQVINAWHAVGLGENVYSDDLSLDRIVSPAKDCGLTNNEIVEVEFQYHATGCDGGIDMGTDIEMSYQVDGETAISEIWTLNEALVEGETYAYSFVEPISLPAIGETINLSVWMDYTADGIPFNDQLPDYEIGLKQALTDSEITFENGTDTETFYYIHTGDNAVAEITSDAANTGTKGFSMSSGTGSPGASFPVDPSLNFDSQKDRISEICFCVDAQEWEYVTVNFDLKQTHSKLYNHFLGADSTEFVSSMRMLVNGAQFSDQFHPDTYVDDPYLTHVFSLDQFDLAGTIFEFCFQSKNFVVDLEIPNPFFPYDSDGDNTYLDNIWFANEETVGLYDAEIFNFEVSPNPTRAFITIDGDIPIPINFEIYAIDGQKVMQGMVSNGNNRIDLTGLSTNIYVLQIGNASYKIIKME